MCHCKLHHWTVILSHVSCAETNSDHFPVLPPPLCPCASMALFNTTTPWYRHFRTAVFIRDVKSQECEPVVCGNTGHTSQTCLCPLLRGEPLVIQDRYPSHLAGASRVLPACGGGHVCLTHGLSLLKMNSFLACARHSVVLWSAGHSDWFGCAWGPWLMLWYPMRTPFMSMRKHGLVQAQ